MACSPKSSEPSKVFFSGEIVNPTDAYVVLYKDDVVIDSAKVDEQDHFSFTLENIEEGLYHFAHKPEYQYIYLRKGDSILTRINTKAFDESLVFAGRGSEINNFLIDLYIAQAHERPWVKSYYKSDPKTFAKKIDSMQAERMKSLGELVINYPLSRKALHVARAAVEYTTFSRKEKYLLEHKKKTGEEIRYNLPDTFYQHRKAADLNNKELVYFRPYFGFVDSYLSNVSYTTKKKKCSGEEKPEDNLLHFSTCKLHLTDSLIQEEKLRNIIFRNTAVNYLLNHHKPGKACEIFIDTFQALSTHEKYKNEINNLYQGIKNLQPGNSLPNVILRTFNDTPMSLRDISRDTTTVFYFWTSEAENHFTKALQHVAHAKKQYPQYKFVGINFKTTYTRWRQKVKDYGLNRKEHYHAKNFRALQSALVVDNLYKCVIAKDTLVVNGFADLYTSFPVEKKELGEQTYGYNSY